MKKTQKKIIIISAVVLTVVAVVTASILLVIKKLNDDFYNPYVENVTRNFDENYINPDEAEQVFEFEYSEPQPINCNKKLNAPVKADTSDFIKDLSDRKIDYKYAKYYKTESHLNNQKKELPKITKHKYDITDGTGIIDEDRLYEVIIKNNEEYLDSFKNKADTDNSIQLYEKAPEKHIRTACKYITKYVKQAAKSAYWQDVDFERIFCNLATLRVMHGTSASFALAFVDEDNILSINEEIIESGKIFVPADKENLSDKEKIQFFWDTTMVHETMHLLQADCSCLEGKDEYLLANMCMSAKEDTSPLVDKWLVEAGAEIEMAKVLKIEPVSYPNNINYHYSLLSSFYPDPDLSARKIMRLTYNKDNFPFYKAFGNKNKEQTIELLNALYSIEMMIYMPDKFVSAYQKDTGINLNEKDDALELVNQNLRVDALKYFTKSFYLSLAKQIKEGKMSYNDMFYTIRMFERALFEHLLYNEEDRLMTSNAFFDEYLSIQNNFFETIGNNYLSKDEIISDFEKYTPKCKSGKKIVDNYKLSWMNKEQKTALENIQANYYAINLPTIRSVKQMYVEKGYDKSLKY